MNRRAGLVAGASVAAGAAGLGAALWAGRQGRPGAGSADTDIRATPFQQPDGGQLLLADFAGRPLLLNFWATWCPPCVTELPLLDRFHRDQPARGWRVVGLAIDQRQPVIEFLRQHPVHFPIGLAGLEGVGWSRRLGNTTGALPFTVLFNRDAVAFDRRLGAIHPEDLAEWVRRAG